MIFSLGFQYVIIKSDNFLSPPYLALHLITYLTNKRTCHNFYVSTIELIIFYVELNGQLIEVSLLSFLLSV